MRSELDRSYALCRRVTRRTASSFYYAMLLAPWAKRRAMFALYAFLRRTDDLGDNDASLESRRTALAQWRISLDRALLGQFDRQEFPALVDAIGRFQMPTEYLYAVIDGVEMDLDGRCYETFDELAEYCYCVASVVGLSCIHIWGFESPAAFEPARKIGLAFQLTNILRDLKEDAEQGRIYLPLQELKQFGYSRQDLQLGVRDAKFRRLIRFQIDRAQQLYRHAEELTPLLHPDGRRVFRAMVGVYRELLDEIRRRDGDVFSRPVRISAWRKFRIASQGFVSAR